MLQSHQKLCVLFARTEFCNQSASLEMCYITWKEIAGSKCLQKCLLSLSYKPEGLFSSRLALSYFSCLGNCYFTLFGSTDAHTFPDMLLMVDGFSLGSISWIARYKFFTDILLCQAAWIKKFLVFFLVLLTRKMWCFLLLNLNFTQMNLIWA